MRFAATGRQVIAPTHLPPFLFTLFFASGEGGKVVAFPGGARDLADLEDHALMERLRGGAEAAFTELFNRWKRPLISYFYRSIADYQLAEDLTLQVARKVFQARERYRPTARFSSWIFQIAHNALRDEIRRRGRQPATEAYIPEWEYPESLSTVGPDRLHEWEDWLEGALALLTDREREILLLGLQQGLSPSEIAPILKMTDNHVRVVLHTARKRLLEHWKAST